MATGTSKYFVRFVISMLLASVATTASKKANGITKRNYFNNSSLLTITVATKKNDAVKRFLLSAKMYGHDVKILGLNSKTFIGSGGHGRFTRADKNLLLRDYLEKAHLQYSRQLILFVDSYDLLLLGTPQHIVKLFQENYPPPVTRVLYSATVFCTPDSSLKKVYPEASKGPMRYINSGSIIGYASDLYGVLSEKAYSRRYRGNDQYFHSRVFVNQTLRNKFGMRIDYEQKIFVVLNAYAKRIMQVKYDENDKPYIYNAMFKTFPVVPHGAGVAKNLASIVANYFLTTSSPAHRLSVETLLWNDESDAPRIAVGAVYKTRSEKVAIRRMLLKTNYPKKRMHIIYVKLSPSSNNIHSQFDQLKNHCKQLDCRFLFILDASADLFDSTIGHLVSLNSSIIAPLLSSRTISNGTKRKSNFFGFSNDFVMNQSLDMTEQRRIGEWHVACASSAVLIRRDYLASLMHPTTFAGNETTPSQFRFCQYKLDNFIYVTNRETFGYLK